MWDRRSHLLHPLTALTSSKENLNIHTDARYYQIGAEVIQDGRPIYFYIRKLTGLQVQSTIEEKELLSVVETLKEFHTILLDQQLKIFTYHKSLTCKDFSTNCVLRWRIIIEEYIP